MKHSGLMLCAAALLIGGAAGGYYGARGVTESARRVPAASDPSSAATRRGPEGVPAAVAPEERVPAEPLAWSELLEPGPTLMPSAKTKGLAGKRVRLVGFMAQMELPIPGAFYLVPQPIDCDEAGGGTADLMPTSVLVLSETTKGQIVPHVPGALDVSGVLEVGNQPGPDGRVSAFRLRLDRGPAQTPREASSSASDISG